MKESTKIKLSKIAKERGFGKWMKGKKASKKTCTKISETKKRLAKEGKLFTKEHLENISKALIGRKLTKPIWNKGLKFPQYSKENSPRWKGGIKVDNDRRKSYDAVNWRVSVFTRDNFTCQCCKEIGGDLQAHHIKSWAHYPELRYDIDNGITLCVDCHKLTDNYGFKSNG